MSLYSVSLCEKTHFIILKLFLGIWPGGQENMSKKFIWAIVKSVFVSNHIPSPTTLIYYGNQGKWENQLNIWWSQRWISINSDMLLVDTHLNFILWINHWQFSKTLLFSAHLSRELRTLKTKEINRRSKKILFKHFFKVFANSVSAHSKICILLRAE